jgi:hypothetical protein
MPLYPICFLKTQSYFLLHYELMLKTFRKKKMFKSNEEIDSHLQKKVLGITARLLSFVTKRTA